MTILFSTSLEPKIRGALRKWLLEVEPGLFVGNLSPRIRIELLIWLKPQMKTGSATIIFPSDTPQKFEILPLLGETLREPIQMDGLSLIKKYKKETPKQTQLDTNPF